MMNDLKVLSINNRLIGRLVNSIPEAKIEHVKKMLDQLANQGYDYGATGAQASFQLWLALYLGSFTAPFLIIRRRVIADEDETRRVCEVTMKIKVEKNEEIFVHDGEGIGPVNAIEQCLRKGLYHFFPGRKEEFDKIKLSTYYAVNLEEAGSESRTRVETVFCDNERSWKTIGCSVDVIAASAIAIKDAFLYFFLNQSE